MRGSARRGDARRDQQRAAACDTILLVRACSIVVMAAVASVACSGSGGPPTKAPALTPSGPQLPPLQPIDPKTRGATFLSTLAGHIQPRWAQFLEDIRMRLPREHPLNVASLTTDIELVLASDSGKLVQTRLMQGSGNSDFDRAAMEVVKELPATPAPTALESDDGQVHVHWVFARDRRQAGPATARVVVVELPLVATVQRLLERGGLARAAKRLAAAAAADGERERATELVMVAALREGLVSLDGYTRESALEAVMRTKIAVLAPEVHHLIEANGQQQQRVLAIAASAALGDERVVSTLVTALELELEDRPEVALAKISALAALDHRDDAAKAIRAALALPHRKRGVVTAVAALNILPDPKLAAELPKWFTRGDSEMRQSVCAALPAAAPGQAVALIARGLRDADASVRATCATAAARHARRTSASRLGASVISRLVELARDRDEAVRMNAVAALAAIGDARAQVAVKAALQDRAPRVRAAAAAGVGEAELRVLATDKDPDVRAAAVAAIVERMPDRAGEVALAAAHDPVSQVQRAGVAGLVDDSILEKLAGDDDPEVATAALVRYAQRRGRAAITTQLLERLAAATPRSLERVRIARAWLLAR